MQKVVFLRSLLYSDGVKFAFCALHGAATDTAFQGMQLVTKAHCREIACFIGFSFFFLFFVFVI